MLHRFFLLRCDLNHNRRQKSLCGQSALPDFLAQLFKQNSFMQCMLVNDLKPLFSCQQQVAILDLQIFLRSNRQFDIPIGRDCIRSDCLGWSSLGLSKQRLVPLRFKLECLLRTCRLFKEILDRIQNSLTPGKLPFRPSFRQRTEFHRRRHLPADIQIGTEQFIPQRRQNLRMHQVGIFKTHLDLGRVNIDIVLFRRHIQEQKHRRIAVGLHQALISLPHGMLDEFIPDESPIEKDILICAAGTRRGGFADEAGNLHPLFLFANRHHGLGQLLAKQNPHPLGQRLSAEQAIGFPGIVNQRQIQRQICQGNACKMLDDMRHFGVCGAKEFPPGWQLIKQVPHIYCCPDIGTGRADGFPLAAIAIEQIGLDGIGRTADECHLGYRGNTGQSLPAKAHRPDDMQVVGLSDLAGRMRLQRQLQIFGIHPAAVVGYSDAFAPAVFDQNRNPCRPGIDAVFQQFLDNTGRPLDDFSGRNHINHIVIENGNPAHNYTSLPVKGIYRRRLLPVISAGLGNPITSRNVGTTSASLPPDAIFLDLKASSNTMNGTSPTVWAV